MLSSFGFPGLIITILAFVGIVYLLRKVFKKGKKIKTEN